MPVLPSTALITSTLNSIKTDTPYLALYTSAPNAGGGGTEVSGGSYARLAITFSAISSGSMSNTAAIVFAGLPNATITHYGVLNAATGGTLKVYGSLNSSVAAVSGDQVQFPVGSITINLAGS